jgi:light-regulated signal transduction histidine kinase (bacteriophytochrome)
VAGESFARLISAAPHELIGPLNQASALIGLFAERQRARGSHETEPLLDLVESAAERMQATVAGLRTYFDIAATRYKQVPVSMEQALHAALCLLDEEIKGTQAVIAFPELPEVTGDARALATLFQILVGNALKFRQPEVPPRIEVSAKRLDTNCVFSIADNGIGIDPEYRDRLFQPFKKLNGHEYRGAGMGLANAKTIVDLHKGSIWIDAKSGKGASISFTLGSPP